MLPRRSCWRRCTETMFTMDRLSMCNGCSEMGVLKPEFLVEGEDGELYVAPEGLGLVNLESVENEELALYWQKRAGSSRQGKNGKLKAAPDRLLRACRFIDLIII